MSSRAFWLGGGILAAFAVGILTGAVSIRPAEVWEGLVNPASPSASIVRELRLPRVLLAFAVGGSLGVCGGALQAMIRNPLADPYLLGLSGGSGLGAVIAISLGGGGRLSVPLAAFARYEPAATARPNGPPGGGSMSSTRWVGLPRSPAKLSVGWYSTARWLASHSSVRRSSQSA